MSAKFETGKGVVRMASALALGALLSAAPIEQANAAQAKKPTLEQAIKKCGGDFKWKERGSLEPTYGDGEAQEHYVIWNNGSHNQYDAAREHSSFDPQGTTPYSLVPNKAGDKVAIVIYYQKADHLSCLSATRVCRLEVDRILRVPAIINVEDNTVQCATMEKFQSLEINPNYSTLPSGRADRSLANILSSERSLYRFQHQELAHPEWRGGMQSDQTHITCAPLRPEPLYESPQIECEQGQIVIGRSNKNRLR